MNAHALETLLRVRDIAVDEARRTVAAHAREEAAALAAERAMEAEIAEETRRASDITSGDSVVEAFALWLRDAHARLARARRLHAERAAMTSQARAALAVARAAREAVEYVMADHLAAQRHAAERIVQHRTDETALDAFRRHH